MPRRIHIVGRKNSGKTTLVCDLVRELTRRGLKVATVKHTHHRHELDTPGKDSHQHRVAGAAAVGIVSPQMTAIFTPMDREERGDERYSQFETAFAGCDLILVEGDLQAAAPRIEVWRSISIEAPYAAFDSKILAVVSDDGVTDVNCPVWPRHPLSEIADRILPYCQPPVGNL
jgi:molybdopterin-guanine dinucleotide biosynthesis protein B